MNFINSNPTLTWISPQIILETPCQVKLNFPYDINNTLQIKTN